MEMEEKGFLTYSQNKVVGKIMKSFESEEGLTEINAITRVNSKLTWPCPPLASCAGQNFM